MKDLDLFAPRAWRSAIIEKKAKQKLSVFGKIGLFIYKKIFRNNISANAIFKPLKLRLKRLRNSDFSHLSDEELFDLKLHVSSYLKYLKVEEKIKIVDDLIIQVDKINSEFYENPPKSVIDKRFLNPPKQKSLTAKSPKVKKQKTASGRVYTHVSVFEELADYKEWLNTILEDANSASYTKKKSIKSNSQFQLNLNVHQFAALFYFLQQEEILIIPDGKKKEFAKTITSVFHTKGQKNVSVDSFVNKFSKPEIEAAEYWKIEFTKLKMATKEID